MPRILIIGSEGQVGQELVKALSSYQQVYTTSHQADEKGPRHFQLDLTDELRLRNLIREVKPSWLINAAAYTAVDKAEEEQDLAMTVNASAVGIIAEEMKSLDGGLIHYSTDYVYDGQGEHFRSETELPAPINFYGTTKLEGEKKILKVLPRHVIFRTSWVFAAHGHNFVKTMLRLGQERESLGVVGDQIGAPTSARLLAYITKAVLAQQEVSPKNYGLYHACCSGSTSWHGFAEEIFRQARDMGLALTVQKVESISSSEFPTPAKRPKNSRLACEKLVKDYSINLSDWQHELQLVLKDLYQVSKRNQ